MNVLTGPRSKDTKPQSNPLFPLDCARPAFINASVIQPTAYSSWTLICAARIENIWGLHPKRLGKLISPNLCSIFDPESCDFPLFRNHIRQNPKKLNQFASFSYFVATLFQFPGTLSSIKLWLAEA